MVLTASKSLVSSAFIIIPMLSILLELKTACRLIKMLFKLFLIDFSFSCKQENQHLTRIEGKQIAITDSLETDASIEAFVKPYRDHINKDLDSVISYAEATYTKSDGELNTAIGNLFADVIYEQ